MILLFYPLGSPLEITFGQGAVVRYSPIMDEVILHAVKGGYVMGVGNGFQRLTELLSSVLLENTNCQFISKNVFIKAQSKSTLISSGLDLNKKHQIPIAHAVGNFYAKKRCFTIFKRQ